MTKEWETIKNQVKGNPKLHYPSFEQEFNLNTDAPARGLGWYLTGGNEKYKHIITIGHRPLTVNEQKMSTIDREVKVLKLPVKKIE